MRQNILKIYLVRVTSNLVIFVQNQVHSVQIWRVILNSSIVRVHCDVCSEPNVLYFIILILYSKIIQSQGTIHHCDCCTKPYQFGTHVKKHIESMHRKVAYLDQAYWHLKHLSTHISAMWKFPALRHPPPPSHIKSTVKFKIARITQI